MSRFPGAPFLKVTGTREQGRRLYIKLSCGHERIHNPKSPVPRQSHCMECEPR